MVMPETIALPSRCTIEAAGELKSLLQPQLAGTAEVVLAGEAVEQVDVAGLQLLLAFGADLTTHGRSWTIARPSEALHQTVLRMGLLEQLPISTDPSVPPARP